MSTETFDNTFAPAQGVVSAEEFTNRTQELEFLWSLADKASQSMASSYAIIARKGMGKTALMMEFYRQLFTQQKKIVPFFVSFAEYRSKPGVVQLTLEQFISKLFVTFALQYGAFKSGKFSTPPELPAWQKEQKEFLANCGDTYLEQQFIGHLEMLENKALNAAFDQAIRFSSYITSLRHEPGFVMIDEFQVLTELYDERYGKFRNITEWFQKPAEARWCPMVVSGSAVSLVVDTVMGGLLARRFGPFYLDPFDQPHSMEYAYKLSRQTKIKLSEEAAAEIHRLTGGNPYYIWCFFNSFGLKDKDLSTLEQVEALYTFECTNLKGKIRGFWDSHFKAVADKINDDKIGLLALYQLAVAKKELRIDEVATEIGIEPEKARRVLKNLEEADLIERQTGSLFPVYDRIKDPILAAYIAREYQTGLVGVGLETFLQTQLQELRQRRGNVARMLGEAAELFTRHVLLSFDGQEVDAVEVFNLDSGNLKLPKFKKVEHRIGLVIEGETIEFDLLAEGDESWLVEVKYRKAPVQINDIEKFIEKLSKFEGWQTPLSAGKRLWFFSRSGFNAEAAARLRELNILHSDLAGFRALCRAVKIGEVPIG